MGTPRLVPAQKATIVDFGLVEGKIRERLTESVARSLAFTHLVAETIFDIASDEVEDHIVDGGGDRGIDIVFIDHNNRRINIGSCKTVSTYKNSQKFFPAEEIDKVISFVDDLLTHREDSFAACNPRLKFKVSEVWDIFSAEHYEVAVHLFSNQATLPDDARARLQDALFRNNVRLYEYGLFELSHGIVKATRPKFKKKLLPMRNSSYAVDDSGTRALVTRVELKELGNFLDLTGVFDERLIWQNVRYFLGLDNDVNREIKLTLQSDEAKTFWYLNSGLTIVCDQIASIANGHHALTLVNPQIVNGCQTAAVIHSVGLDTLAGIPEGSVQVKIIETTDARFIEQISLASNTQSRILGRDLRANDLFQQQIATALRAAGIFYRRKRGETAPSKTMPIIDAARAGQLLLAYACGEPAKSKTNSNDIFGDLYLEAFNPGQVTPDLIFAAHGCHQNILDRRSKAVAWQSSIAKDSYDEAWIVEGHFHVLFVVAELMRRSGLSLESYEGAISLIDEAFSIVQEFVNRHKKVSFYRLFRLQNSKDDLQRIIDETSGVVVDYPVQLRLDV